MPSKNPTITSIETLKNPEYPKIVWVRIGTSDGLFGLGETSFDPDTIEAWVHEDAATYLLGEDATQLDLHWDKLQGHGARHRARSSDMSGISAVDMALWDLYAKRHDVPLYVVLGGLSRDRIKVYNTCAGFSYGVKRGGRLEAGSVDYRPEKPYEDQHAFLTDAGALADDLLSEGFTAMKIWPFDQFVDKTSGQFISKADLDEGTEPFRKIREKVGNRMDVMVEMHSLWNLPSAVRVAKAVEPTDPFWFEDPVPMDNIDALAEFRRSTHIATTASETVTTRWAFREMMEKQAMTICMFDISWVGGISEAKRISTMAEAYRMPVAPHDCVGPVTLMFSVHLSLNAPNALIQETVRAYNATWYKDIVTNLPRIEGGYAYPPEGAGSGTELLESFLKHEDTTIKLSEV
jgi:L-alanine-DL-glutamate epimerase-like enolase superfamily enzyme